MNATRTLSWLVIVGGGLLIVGCQATVGASGSITVPKDAATRCNAHCESIAMSLDSVVIMANNVGCVCRPAQAAPPNGKAAASAGGMAAILMQEEQQNVPPQTPAYR